MDPGFQEFCHNFDVRRRHGSGLAADGRGGKAGNEIFHILPVEVHLRPFGF
jgi:hypothetical protein